MKNSSSKNDIIEDSFLSSVHYETKRARFLFLKTNDFKDKLIKINMIIFVPIILFPILLNALFNIGQKSYCLKINLNYVVYRRIYLYAHK